MGFLFIIAVGLLAGIISSYLRTSVSIGGALICGVVSVIISIIIELLTGFGGGLITCVILSYILTGIYERHF